MYFRTLFRNKNVKFIKRLYSINLSKLSPEDRIKTLREMTLPKTRENPVIMKLDTPEFQSIFTDELKKLASLFKEYGYEIRVVGGAVRDLLMGLEPKDLDFATTATPIQMKDMFTTEEVRMINMNGEKHGTITPRINDIQNFEVTTLRIDVVTDGRRAEVQFTTDWMLDSLRRDLTINSMFLGLDGSVYDYFFGYDDLKKHRIVFVGEAATRIQEDYLRILRYFRFYGRIAVDANNHDEITLKAIKENGHGLKNISGERIWMELKNILEGKFACELMKKILECDLGAFIGLPNNPNTKELQRVWDQGKHSKLSAISLLCTLINTQDDVLALHNRLKLSAFERDLALFIVEHREAKLHEKPLMPYQMLVLKSKTKPSDTKKMAIELFKYNNLPYLEEFENWEIPKFPVTGAMLKERGVEIGRNMGIVMAELKNYWADHEFTNDVDEILKELPNVVEKLESKKKKK